MVQSAGGDLDAIRARIEEIKGEISRVQLTPVLSGDLGARIADHVAALGLKAKPIVSGVGHGEALRVLYPLHDHADRITQTGFSDHEGNALLLAALLDGKRLAERLLQVATETAITANERSLRLQACRRS